MLTESQTSCHLPHKFHAKSTSVYSPHSAPHLPELRDMVHLKAQLPSTPKTASALLCQPYLSFPPFLLTKISSPPPLPLTGIVPCDAQSLCSKSAVHQHHQLSLNLTPAPATPDLPSHGGRSISRTHPGLTVLCPFSTRTSSRLIRQPP